MFCSREYLELLTLPAYQRPYRKPLLAAPKSDEGGSFPLAHHPTLEVRRGHFCQTNPNSRYHVLAFDPYGGEVVRGATVRYWYFKLFQAKVSHFKDKSDRRIFLKAQLGRPVNSQPGTDALSKRRRLHLGVPVNPSDSTKTEMLPAG